MQGKRDKRDMERERDAQRETRETEKEQLKPTTLLGHRDAFQVNTQQKNTQYTPTICTRCSKPCTPIITKT
jgi:hypothetical protein